MENWISVYKFNKKNKKLLKWFYEIMDEENIPYKEEVEGKCITRGKIPEYEENIVIYVPGNFKNKVEEYIKNYNDPKNIIYEESQELKLDDKEEKEFSIEIENAKKNRKLISKGLAWITIVVFLIMVLVVLVTNTFV